MIPAPIAYIKVVAEQSTKRQVLAGYSSSRRPCLLFVIVGREFGMFALECSKQARSPVVYTSGHLIPTSVMGTMSTGCIAAGVEDLIYPYMTCGTCCMCHGCESTPHL